MSELAPGNRLDRPVDDRLDHILGPSDAAITLVEYGSYACPYCRAANERIAEVRDQFGDRLRYVFRHKPLVGNPLARPAAELVERAPDAGRFWAAHVKLMTRSEVLTEDDLIAVAQDLAVQDDDDPLALEEALRAKARVQADEASAAASGALITPTFFINGRRYDGPWDESAFADAMLGTLGHRVRSAALDFVSWGPSAGVLLMLAAAVAIAVANTPFGPEFAAFWEQSLGLTVGGHAFALPLAKWIDDGLLTIFFLVVGLEIKREFTVGRLASWRSAALPVAGALGGLIAPAVVYLLCVPSGPWSRGWGVPMSTDTAFAVALIVMMGPRVPVELRIFLTAAAIVDDLGAIAAVAVFYSGELHLAYFLAAVPLVGVLAMLNRSHTYAAFPYVVVGVALWAAVLASGLHPTLAGVVLALFIPTRPPPNLKALTTQASVILTAEAERGREALRHGPSLPALRALEGINDRLEIAGRSAAAARRVAVELSRAAAVRAGQRRCRDQRRRIRRARAAHGRNRARPAGRQAARHLGALRPRGRPQARGQAAGLFLAAGLRRGFPRRDRFHHVPVHRRTGVRRPGGFRGGQNRRSGRFCGRCGARRSDVGGDFAKRRLTRMLRKSSPMASRLRRRRMGCGRSPPT